MKKRIFTTILLCIIFSATFIGCGKRASSKFIEDSFKPRELLKLDYRVLKSGAEGTDTGFKLVWIPLVSPTESAAKLDLLARLKDEGIDTTGKNIAFSNATYDRAGNGLFGIIGAPTITLVADVIEILPQVPPQTLSSQE